MAIGGPFDCYPLGYPCSTYPYAPQTADAARPHPNVMDQMGVDPISKLAAAIEKLADALARQQ